MTKECKCQHLVSEELTSREVETLTWMARGKTYDQISIVLKISRTTVKSHIENARHKLNAKNKTHAIAIAIKHGLIICECSKKELPQHTVEFNPP